MERALQRVEATLCTLQGLSVVGCGCSAGRLRERDPIFRSLVTRCLRLAAGLRATRSLYARYVGAQAWRVCPPIQWAGCRLVFPEERLRSWRHAIRAVRGGEARADMVGGPHGSGAATSPGHECPQGFVGRDAEGEHICPGKSLEKVQRGRTGHTRGFPHPRP